MSEHLSINITHHSHSMFAAAAGSSVLSENHCCLLVGGNVPLCPAVNLMSNSSQQDSCFLSVLVYMFNFLVNDRNKLELGLFLSLF